jgi:hypothetical protein
VLLFDGLDEVSEGNVAGVVELITTLRSRFGTCRFVVTCRSYDYSLSEPNRRLPFPSLRLLLFSLADQLSYVDNWYNALAQVQAHARVEERKTNLRETLKPDEKLARAAKL